MEHERRRTVESSLSVMAAFFIAGGIWVSLSEDIIRAQTSINRHALELIDLSRDLNSIESDIRLLAANTAHNQESSKEIKADLAVIDSDIKEILQVINSR